MFIAVLLTQPTARVYLRPPLRYGLVLFQNHTRAVGCATLMTFLRLVAKALDYHGIEHTEEKPYGLVTDGHSPRYNIEVMRLARELHISLYFLPSHATTICQPLDKLLDSWHKQHSGKLAMWRTEWAALALLLS